MGPLTAIVLGAAAGGGFPQWNCRCAVCRLAWVVDVSGGPSDSFTLLTVFVDAGDGTILGGDVVE